MHPIELFVKTVWLLSLLGTILFVVMWLVVKFEGWVGDE
jgi:hypothetical protein